MLARSCPQRFSKMKRPRRAVTRPPAPARSISRPGLWVPARPGIAPWAQKGCRDGRREPVAGRPARERAAGQRSQRGNCKGTGVARHRSRWNRNAISNCIYMHIFIFQREQKYLPLYCARRIHSTAEVNHLLPQIGGGGLPGGSGMLPPRCLHWVRMPLWLP